MRTPTRPMLRLLSLSATKRMLHRLFLRFQFPCHQSLYRLRTLMHWTLSRIKSPSLSGRLSLSRRMSLSQSRRMSLSLSRRMSLSQSRRVTRSPSPI